MIVTAQITKYKYKSNVPLWLLSGGAWKQISHESISRYIDQNQRSNHFKKLKISTPAEGSLNIVFAINAKRFLNLGK